MSTGTSIAPAMDMVRTQDLLQFHDVSRDLGFGNMVMVSRTELIELLKLNREVLKESDRRSKQSNLRDHMVRELEIMDRLQGEDIIDGDDPLHDYANAITNSIRDLMEVFISQGHSGMSAELTLRYFEMLARFQAITPLDDNPDDWVEVSREYNSGTKFATYQSKRHSSVFSEDHLRTWYDIDRPNWTKHLPFKIRRFLPKKWKFASGKLDAAPPMRRKGN
ncbi:MAG: hypothetical protein E6Q68_07585 [Polynucleobacter sp.]|nr:MAG: hypothetical protein E6Q68_07585 [Polynucleobacter sp.]